MNDEDRNAINNHHIGFINATSQKQMEFGGRFIIFINTTTRGQTSMRISFHVRLRSSEFTFAKRL